MERLFIITGIVCLLSAGAVAAERSMLARVTVYWASGGSGSDHWTRKHQAATKVRLREGHCAVDPRKIPYGSKIILPDATLTAVDTGGHVKSRRASRIGRSSAQKNALVVDRFFETKSEALAWAKKNPHFMKVRVVSRSNLIESTPAGKTRTTTTTTSTATRVAATKRTEPAVIATSKQTKQTVVASAPTPAAIASVQSPAPAQPALRTSVPTARTPAASTVARPRQPSSVATAGAIATNAKPANPAAASSATAPTAPVVLLGAPRVASNSSAASVPTAKPQAPGVMVHGPSHH
ncbi:MAG TPA: hypothetical protein VF551_00645, partial [Chthoniobacterales bacterium]